jgi:hypothetical protein
MQRYFLENKGKHLMKITRLFTGFDGESHFQDIDIPLKDAEFGKITDAIAVEDLRFGEIEDLNEIPWHKAPRAQYIIMIQGSMEIEIGDGSKRTFKEGDIVLAEDLTGQGHITRATSQGTRRYMIIPLKIS